MASSSVGDSSATLLRCRARKCNCGKKAAVKISEIAANPDKLFFSYRDRKCTFFDLCVPPAKGGWDEVCSGTAMQVAGQAKMERDITELKHDIVICMAELAALKTSVQSLKLLAVAIAGLLMLLLIMFFVVLLVK